ncbi:MAG TPA: DUF4328 domain-containing protein [Byssovorax sp.]|jgi:hypothetical protein
MGGAWAGSIEPSDERSVAIAKGGRRARSASATIAAGCLLHVAATGGLALTGRQGSELSFLSMVVGAATAVAFLSWVGEAHAAALHVRPGFPGAISRAKAVRAYLVPVLNLVAPLDHMERLEMMSDPRDVPAPPPGPGIDANATYRDNARRATVERRWRHPRTPIAAWWMCLLATIALGATTRWIARAPFALVLTWEAAYLALHLATAWLCVEVMRAITELQRERARRLEAFARA